MRTSSPLSDAGISRGVALRATRPGQFSIISGLGAVEGGAGCAPERRTGSANTAAATVAASAAIVMRACAIRALLRINPASQCDTDFSDRPPIRDHRNAKGGAHGAPPKNDAFR